MCRDQRIERSLSLNGGTNLCLLTGAGQAANYLNEVSCPQYDRSASLEQVSLKAVFEPARCTTVEQGVDGGVQGYGNGRS